MPPWTAAYPRPAAGSTRRRERRSGHRVLLQQPVHDPLPALGRQDAEERAEARDAHHEVRVLRRVGPGLEDLLPGDDVDVDERPALPLVGLDQALDDAD